VSQESEPTNVGAPRACSIADALEVVGERWSLLVLRELGFGVYRFNDIQVNTGAPRETLALRLRKLEEAGVIERRRYCDRPPRDEYVPTAAGRDLFPVLTALREWGERHVTPFAGDADEGSRTVAGRLCARWPGARPGTGLAGLGDDAGALGAVRAQVHDGLVFRGVVPGLRRSLRGEPQDYRDLSG
jgi:DNA-binding HxlR family transcriptional regulator